MSRGDVAGSDREWLGERRLEEGFFRGFAQDYVGVNVPDLHDMLNLKHESDILLEQVQQQFLHFLHVYTLPTYPSSTAGH